MPGLWLLPTRALLLLAWLCFYFWGFSLPSLLLFIPSCRNSLSRRKRTNRRNCQHTNQLSCVLQIHPRAGNWEEKGRAIHWFTAPVKPGESPPPSHTPSPHGWPDAVLQTSLTIKSSSVFTLQDSTGSMRHLCKTQARLSLLQKFEHSALDLSTNKRPGYFSFFLKWFTHSRANTSASNTGFHSKY